MIGLVILACGIVVGVLGVFAWFALTPSPGRRWRREQERRR